MPKKEDVVLEWIRIKVKQDSNDAFKSVEVDIPVDFHMNYAIIIHEVICHYEGIPAIDLWAVQAGIVKRELDALPAEWLEDWIVPRYYTIGRCVTCTETAFVTKEINAHWIASHDNPLLYARKKLYGVIDSNLTGTQNTVTIWIGYTIQKVTKQEFIDALTEP